MLSWRCYTTRIYKANGSSVLFHITLIFLNSQMSTQPWKCALVTGGGGGIFSSFLHASLSLTQARTGLGKAFAQSLITRGKKVYIAGCTESNVSATAKEIGAAGYFVVDLGDLASLPAFIEKVTKEAPEVDCLLNNAGVQVRAFPVCRTGIAY